MFKSLGTWSGNGEVLDVNGLRWTSPSDTYVQANINKRCAPRRTTTWISLDTWNTVATSNSIWINFEATLRSQISQMATGGKLSIQPFSHEGDFMFALIAASKLHYEVDRHMYVPPPPAAGDLLQTLGLSDSTTLGSEPGVTTATIIPGVLANIGTEEVTSYLDWTEFQAMMLTSSDSDRYVCIGYDDDGEYFLNPTQCIGSSFQYYMRWLKPIFMNPGDSIGAYSIAQVTTDIGQIPTGNKRYEPITNAWPSVSGSWQATPWCSLSGVHSMSGDIKVKDCTWSSNFMDGQPNAIFVQCWPEHTATNSGTIMLMPDRYSLLAFANGSIPSVNGASIQLSVNRHSLYDFGISPAGTNIPQDPIVHLLEGTAVHGLSLNTIKSTVNTSITIAVDGRSDTGSEILADALIGKMQAGCIILHGMMNTFGDAYWL